MPQYDDDWDVPEDRDYPENEENIPDEEDILDDEEIPEEEDILDEEEIPDEENTLDEEHTPDGEKKKKLTWKTVLLALVVFAIVGSLVQVVARGGFGGALNTTGSGGGGAPKKEQHSRQEQEIRPPKQPKTIKLGNQRVPQASGPIIVINPGLVTPGGSAAVEGGGFDKKATVDILIKARKSDTKGRAIGSVRSDRFGSIYARFTMPDTAGNRPATLVAQQRGSSKTAEAKVITGGAVGTAKINKMVGRPGDVVTVSARGFRPGEPIDVFWGRTTGIPVTTLHTDGSGGVAHAAIKVGVAPTGSSTLVLVGKRSKTTATAPFQMLAMYPSMKSKPYALKAGQRITLSANKFAPGERVLVYINSTGGLPAFTAQANGMGQIRDVAFNVPFGLKGRQTLMAIGDQSRAVVRSGFTVLPYSPSAEPSAFGGRAGTTLSFYVAGFAPGETVTAYAGSGSKAQRKIGTFQVDSRGKAAAVGSYKITPADESGVSFQLIGQKSGGVARASINMSQGRGD
ncbi:hypothetical protein [Streptomyces rapamycinicus]|uniref:Aromatic ring-opening dioxygenase LigA n=2 Tax=Streptomyces rapamycinicus TaxID=1226757 RepID=A0A0A0NBM7_STRRN|nr:hypothetical protein [Streptomyces rapamycinicus]AGP56857.1 aromatic ring-opening dioxygenase LigA [Streptomyces rapamycinicus NRRL 5491]MBB4784477.1 hypothetical protein [Streptomyces rapamycinicus]RLV80040.1 aromatic ring-opening dioxygenase LigA [Streptomyces rapamycinicus NRRL 5491]UTO64781.1 hypothetical protein LJB45_22270 [Streptomyces rapamycinicus]UTP32738.1 hypothetical protein LIV37_27395 [Streptomyces rapamycinicus NRRL 5491]